MKVDDKYKDKKWEDLTEVQQTDIDKRRKLEFCQFMVYDKEKEAINNGFNILNMNLLVDYPHYIQNQLNLHVISTPNRKIITQELCLEAIEKDYNPIVLGIYGSQNDKYHLFIKGENEKCVDNIMGDGEFNCKLNRLIINLQKESYDINRPLIIIGNYTPTGESLSFVNYNYGTIRSVVKLISTNAEILLFLFAM